jgi:hypothetical protein
MGSPPRLTTVCGTGLEWLIQQWVQSTGTVVRLDDAPWLAGPIGTRRIGQNFYQTYADYAGLELSTNTTGAGLLPDFSCLRGGDFVPEQVDDEIRRFYERTTDYALDVWSQWHGPLQPFAKTLIMLVSRDIQQLNLPLSPLETGYGMSSDIIQLIDRQTGSVAYTGWLRRTVATDAIIYAGFYTTCHPSAGPGPCVKVVFPLPQGSATVILRPENQADGSLKLVSAGTGLGGPGYYRVHHVSDTAVRVKYVPIKETIHVYRDSHQVLRTNHTFAFWHIPFLTLHYKITPKRSS